MNKIILLGRLTRDPEVRYTQTGKVSAQFTLAVNRPYASADGQKEADFIPVIIWGKSAELAGNSLAKGQRVLVDGRLQIRPYTAKDGSKKSVTEVIADRFEFIEHREQQPAPQNQLQPQPQAQGWSGMGAQVPDEEIPF